MQNIDFAKEVYSHFDLIINREPTSTQNLKKWNFESENVKDFACPAFLYTPDLTEMENDRVNQLIDKITYQNKKKIGFTIGGFNLPVGPYDMWPREDWQYEIFAKTIEHIINNYDATVILISHTNGFELPPNFRLINGRDYPILKQLRDEEKMSVVLITHDLGVVASLSNRISVMYGGLIMEEGLTDEIFYAPKHPYTRALLHAIPQPTTGVKERLEAIPGMAPSLTNPPAGCPFAPRCADRREACDGEIPVVCVRGGRVRCILYTENS